MIASKRSTENKWHFSLWGMLKLTTAISVGVVFWMIMFVSPDMVVTVDDVADGSIIPSLLLSLLVVAAVYGLLSILPNFLRI